MYKSNCKNELHKANCKKEIAQNIIFITNRTNHNTKNQLLCFGNEASRGRYVGWSVRRSVSTQLSKKFKRCHARSILYSLCTLVRALVQCMCTHNCGQNTVRNRARILAWALTWRNLLYWFIYQNKIYLHRNFPGQSIFLLAGLCFLDTGFYKNETMTFWKWMLPMCSMLKRAFIQYDLTQVGSIYNSLLLY